MSANVSKCQHCQHMQKQKHCASLTRQTQAITRSNRDLPNGHKSMAVRTQNADIAWGVSNIGLNAVAVTISLIPPATLAFFVQNSTRPKCGSGSLTLLGLVVKVTVKPEVGLAMEILSLSAPEMVAAVNDTFHLWSHAPDNNRRGCIWKVNLYKILWASLHTPHAERLTLYPPPRSSSTSYDWLTHDLASGRPAWFLVETERP